jgi:hypothetical protein
MVVQGLTTELYLQLCYFMFFEYMRLSPVKNIDYGNVLRESRLKDIAFEKKLRHPVS